VIMVVLAHGALCSGAALSPGAQDLRKLADDIIEEAQRE
jgi:hypothetical protein